jgi:hypothetical protein
VSSSSAGSAPLDHVRSLRPKSVPASESHEERESLTRSALAQRALGASGTR